LRDFGDAYARDAFMPLRDHIRDTPQLAADLIFGGTKSPRQGTVTWLYYVPLIALLMAAALFATRPKMIALIPRRH
jgi:hypothetical protein